MDGVNSAREKNVYARIPGGEVKPQRGPLQRVPNAVEERRKCVHSKYSIAAIMHSKSSPFTH